MLKANQTTLVGSLDQFQLALYASKAAEPPLNGTDLAVLLELIDRYRKKERITFPSSAGHLARETGRPVRSVQESLRRLQDMHLAQIVEQGSGTRGNTYTFNFDWVREAASEIKAEVESRAVARKKRRHRNPASTAENRVAGDEPLPTRESAPLRDIVTRKFAYLTGVATQDSAPQTYGVPTETLRRCAGTPPLGLSPMSGAAPLGQRRVTIVEACLNKEGTETFLDMKLADLDDEEDLRICVESDSLKRQQNGQREFEQLRIAIDRHDIEDVQGLVGGQLLFRDDGEFLPVPASTAKEAA